MSLRPSLQFRGYEAAVDESLVSSHKLTFCDGRYEISGGAEIPPLRFLQEMTRGDDVDEKGAAEVPHDMERSRGYASMGSLWSPGYFRADLHPDCDATLVASTESWEAIHALAPEGAAEAEMDRRRRPIHIAGSAARSSPRS